MANVMSFKNVKNKPHRSAFDLSYKNAFTAKVGELLPCFIKEVLPGDKFHINPSHFTRTSPVNTAAFTRIRENVDFFFVPYRLLWDKWTQFIAMTDDSKYASGLTSVASAVNTTPFTQAFRISNFLNKCVTHDGTGSDISWHDAVSMPLSMTTPKLLQYLGYGALVYNLSLDDRQVINDRTAVSLFRACAYQKIYYDYFRNSQWEFSKPYCYNFDYVMKDADAEIPVDNMLDSQVLGQPCDCMFTMRYANYSKDIVLGLNPSSQFGDTAIAGPVLGNLYASFPGASTSLSANLRIESSAGPINNISGVSRAGWLSLLPNSENTSGISVLAIRLAESLQKYREITLTGSKDYKDQIEKHWGVRVPDYASDLCQRVYSYDSMVEISEVVNSNVSDAAADIKGKGVSAGQGGFTWHNDSNDYGILMGIYHAEPLLDYQADNFFERHLTNVLPSSFPIPEMDSVGMEGVPASEIYIPVNMGIRSPLESTRSVFGYAPRYFEFKTSRDIFQGGFGSYGHFRTDDDSLAVHMQYNGGFADWVSGYGQNFIPQLPYTYLTFKINPLLLNSIFQSQVTFKPKYLSENCSYPSYDNDQLLVKAFFDCNVIRNLSFDGLPY